MDVRCERCKTQYELDDARISETGVTVQCTTCQHVFVVKKKALVVTVPVKPGPDSPAQMMPMGGTPPAPSSSPPPGLRPLGTPIGTQPPMATGSVSPEPASSLPPPTSAPGAREWRVRQASGNVFSLKDLTTLQKWIVERKVSRDDEISVTGDTWKRLGDIADLATFFQLVDEAQRGAVLQAQVNLGLIPGAAPPGGTQGPSAAGPRNPGPPAGPPSQPPPPERTGSKLPLLLVLLLLLGAGGAAGYYFGVLVPEEEARSAAAARLEEQRREKERQEQLLAAQAAADAQLRADAGSDAGPSEAGGAPGAGLPGDGDAGMADAGTPDGGGLVDGGMAADAGAPGAKRPAPVRNFDYWISQGDRLRERERPEAALDAYAEAAELEPGRAEPYSGRGMALLDMGEARQAETEFNQALKINPNYGEAIIGLAETYRSRGKKAEAIRYYERYLEILPNGPEASVARNAIERLKE